MFPDVKYGEDEGGGRQGDEADDDEANQNGQGRSIFVVVVTGQTEGRLEGIKVVLGVARKF